MRILFDYAPGKPSKLQSEGSVDELAVAIGFLVSELYASTFSADKLAAEFFKYGVQAIVADDSPVWKAKSAGRGVTMVLPKKAGGIAYET